MFHVYLKVMYIMLLFSKASIIFNFIYLVSDGVQFFDYLLTFFLLVKFITTEEYWSHHLYLWICLFPLNSALFYSKYFESLLLGIHTFRNFVSSWWTDNIIIINVPLYSCILYFEVYPLQHHFDYCFRAISFFIYLLVTTYIIIIEITFL